MKFSNSYISLGPPFYQKTAPVPVNEPRLFIWNGALADELLIPDELRRDEKILSEIFSGNRLLPGSEPIAMAYAGHQFGHFVSQLGDGRAHLLGEVLDKAGRRRDIQLKGSGPTLYSRGGDGRYALGPAIREFVMSEALYALGVPTARSLAVVATGEPVMRGKMEPGAVVTRVASSHLRIGTFQFFSARGDKKAIRTLADYTIERHFPEIQRENKDPARYLGFFEAVMDRVINTVVHWMRVGFIHGVMNTDNISLSGETIDYGPCAMMGRYDPGTVYSAIDCFGRYAFGRQPQIAHWNLARLAESLLPIIDEEIDRAVDASGQVLERFPSLFENAWLRMMRKKLGLNPAAKGDDLLITQFLDWMQAKGMDYTVTFHDLTRSLTSARAAARMRKELGHLYDLWLGRLKAEGRVLRTIQAQMRRENPVVIPRNHHMEAVIAACLDSGRNEAAETFLGVLRFPYKVLGNTNRYQDLPEDDDKDYKTFCGT